MHVPRSLLVPRSAAATLAFVLAASVGVASARATDAPPRPASKPRATATSTATADDSVAALDWAFRVASAIESDESDRARGQAAVVLDLVEAGRLDLASAWAPRVDGWQRSVVLAELAAAAARRARREGSAADAELARRSLDEARAAADTIDGWRRARAQAHLASAVAALGEGEAATSLAARLAEADPRQYGGRSAALVAASLAATGRAEDALEALDDRAGTGDDDVEWWRARGYLDLAAAPDVAKPLRLRAARAAALEGVHGWRRIHAARDLARALADLGEARRAGETLAGLGDELSRLPQGSPLRVPLATELALAHADAGDSETALEWLRGAEEAMAAARASRKEVRPGTAGVLLIEEPALLARMGAARAAAGDPDGARRLLDEALEVAATLTNARPRALALVAAGRAWADSRLPLDRATRARLEVVLDELGPPW